ncbi:MAG: tRNA 2-thiouridine(34) synthase MnmA [Mycoplasmoidaceae bacterium]
MKKKIIIALSGGVDSAVAAYLLLEEGYDVEAIFMINWDSFLNNEDKFVNSNNSCSTNIDLESAKKVANKLNIKLNIVNFVKPYWDKVFMNFIDKFNSGLTPNPDIICNKYIKFEVLRKYISDNFNTSYFATGHYAIKKKNLDNSYDLLISKDYKKDQTYFLCQLNQEQIKNAYFPIGKYRKEEIRKIAKSIGLHNWNRKDSTGICFIGKRKFQIFLENYISIKKGDIIDIESNEVLGQHKSVNFFTIGQRKSIGLSGMKKKYYVCKKDLEKNILYVCSNDNLIKINNYKNILLDNFNWINKKLKSGDNIFIRYRHCGLLIDAKLDITDKIIIILKEYQKSISLGQYLVVYKNDICIGGGEIIKVW